MMEPSVSEEKQALKSSPGDKTTADILENRAIRPPGLRGSLIRLYLVLAGVVCAFAAITWLSRHAVPNGMYEKLDGTLVSFAEYDPAELGPFPKCHPHYEQHYSVKDGVWKKNSELGEEITTLFPVGHPKNEAWVEKRKELQKAVSISWKSLLPSLHLLFLAVLVTYLGCKHSVWLYVKPDPNSQDAIDDIENVEDLATSPLQDSNAYWFPIFGSCVLFGLFLMFEYLDKEWINFLVTAYVVIMSSNSLGANISEFVSVMLNSRGLRRIPCLFTIPYFNFRTTWVDIVAQAAGLCVGIAYLLTKNWIANNILGLSFCILGIKHVGLASYKTGLILLCGLFVYDIFWVFGSSPVFGSNVMVAVATGVDAPIKLLFPRGQDGCGNLSFSMLGLGDIVVPGLVVSLLSKFDVSRSDAKVSPGWPYLNWTMISYTLSLITTVSVMLVWNHAQPALLYIVPYVMVSSLGVAIYKKQLKDLFAYEIEDLTKDNETKAQTEKKKE